MIAGWKDISCINIEESEELLIKAEEYFKIGVKAKDAIHVASALLTHCNYFLTTDKGILKKAKLISGLEILGPIEFVNKLEEL